MVNELVEVGAGSSDGVEAKAQLRMTRGGQSRGDEMGDASLGISRTGGGDGSGVRIYPHAVLWDGKGRDGKGGKVLHES